MKTIRNVLVVILMLLMASGAWAAGTITGKSYMTSRDDIRFIVYTVTFDAAAASPANVALDNIKDANGGSLPSVAGWWLFSVSTQFGGTGPTDDTDMYLYLAEGASKNDILGASGVNSIDNATNNTIYPATSTQPLLGTEIISFANNAVNNATCTLIYRLYR